MLIMNLVFNSYFFAESENFEYVRAPIKNNIVTGRR